MAPKFTKKCFKIYRVRVKISREDFDYMDFLKRYLSSGGTDKGAIAMLANLDCVMEEAPDVGQAIMHELDDQRQFLKLIASENFCSLATQAAMGNWMTDKYSEGIIGKRFYAGCENVDTVETLATEELKKIFGCDHAYVQPRSGADANLVAFLAILAHRLQDDSILKMGDEEHEQLRQKMVNQTVMGLALDSGGHLTHGYRLNISSKLFKAVSYSVDHKSELIDMDALDKQVKEVKPLILIVGYSAYPRLIDFSRMREIADSVGATLMVDMAHFAGLVAGKVMTGVNDPVPYADVVTSTTHKTLRGPRGGLVMCKEEYRAAVDKGCPLVLGGPLPHVMAAKAVAFKEVNTPEFRNYAAQVVKNAQAMAEAFLQRGARLMTGGTDNHLLVVDVAQSFGVNGRQAENALREAGITVNRNTVPFDVNGPWYTSGVRIGTPAMTTLGMGADEMKIIANAVCDLFEGATPAIVEKTGAPSKNRLVLKPERLKGVQGIVKELLENYPLYPEISWKENTIGSRL